jgi:hypothetical protein
VALNMADMVAASTPQNNQVASGARFDQRVLRCMGHADIQA